MLGWVTSSPVLSTFSHRVSYLHVLRLPPNSGSSLRNDFFFLLTEVHFLHMTTPYVVPWTTPGHTQWLALVISDGPEPNPDIAIPREFFFYDHHSRCIQNSKHSMTLPEAQHWAKQTLMALWIEKSNSIAKADYQDMIRKQS